LRTHKTYSTVRERTMELHVKANYDGRVWAGKKMRISPGVERGGRILPVRKVLLTLPA